MTQNANESFHSKIWSRAHKTKFAGAPRIQFVCKTTILDHNFGYQKATVLKSLKIDSEALEKSLEIQDKERKKRSTAMKAPKRITRSAKNTTEYNPGGF